MMEDEGPKPCRTCKETIDGPYYFYSNSGTYECVRCVGKAKVAKWEKTGWLDNHLILDAMLAVHAHEAYPHLEYMTREQAGRLSDINNRLHDAIKLFEKRFWQQGGFYKLMQTTRQRGHRADKEGRTVLAYSLAGRVMVTITPINKDTPSISIIYDESSPEGRSGMQSVYGTEQEALDLLAVHVVAAEFRSDDNVNMGF
jgi:hypothetical protein